MIFWYAGVNYRWCGECKRCLWWEKMYWSAVLWGMSSKPICILVPWPCSPPGYTLSREIQGVMRQQVCKLTFELQVRGLMNVQFVVKNNKMCLIEVNLRASRTASMLFLKPPAWWRWYKWLSDESCLVNLFVWIRAALAKWAHFITLWKKHC